MSLSSINLNYQSCTLYDIQCEMRQYNLKKRWICSVNLQTSEKILEITEVIFYRVRSGHYSIKHSEFPSIIKSIYILLYIYTHICILIYVDTCMYIYVCVYEYLFWSILISVL